MVPVIRALRETVGLRTVVISTGQHREMLSQMLKRFAISIDYEMDLMEPNQSLYRLSAKAIKAFEEIFKRFTPSVLLVQGDTTTAFFGALGAFYAKVPVGHIEAGLRTNDKYFPFPEEINRRLITSCADLHFCPTEGNRENLRREGVAEDSIYVTGNTGIDTVLLAAHQLTKDGVLSHERMAVRKVLVTIHRRESFGDAMIGIFQAIREIAEAYADVEIIYPVHLNPNVRNPAREILGGVRNIRLVEPMDYFEFVATMQRSYFVLSDSGGVQEEAPTLGVPVLVLRNETERPEAIDAGTVRLVGTNRSKIVREARRLLDDPEIRKVMSRATNPYGDGHSAPRIAAIVQNFVRQP